MSSGCSFSQKTTEGKLQNVTIKCTFGPQKRSGTLYNEAGCFPGARGRHTCKEEENGTIQMLVVAVLNEQITGKQQSNIPLALPEGQELVFLVISVDSNREKKERKRKERNKTHMSIIL